MSNPDAIDPELRVAGRIAQFLGRPSRRGLSVMHRLTTRSKTAGVKGADGWTIHVPRRDGDGSIRTRVFRPPTNARPLPMVVYLHGGGYAIGTPEQENYRRIYRMLLDTRDCVIAAPDYRRSLDAPYPAGIDDCHDVLRWVHRHAEALGGRSDQIIVAGDSAGGGLTLALALRCRDLGDVPIAYQMPLYPMIDDRQTNPSAVGNDMPVWNSAYNAVGWELYLADLVATGKPIPADAAPARADDLSGLPPTATFVGTLDPFLDETRQLVERLREAGVEVAYEEYAGAYHGFDQVMPTAAVSRRANEFLLGAFAAAVDSLEASSG